MGITGSQKALHPAYLGPMRLGATRLGYYPPTVLVQINGVARTANTRIAGVRIDEYEGGTPNSATLRVAGFTPAVGHEIKIGLARLDLRRLLFAGHLVSVQQVYEDRPANVAWDLSCIDYTWLLNRRLVSQRYRNQSATAILVDLIASFTSGLSSAGVEAGLPVLDEITFTNEEVADAIDRTCRRIGAYWTLDYGKVLQVALTASDRANPVTDALPHTTRDLRVTTDLSQVRTRVYVEGAGSRLAAAVAAAAALAQCRHRKGDIRAGPHVRPHGVLVGHR